MPWVSTLNTGVILESYEKDEFDILYGKILELWQKEGGEAALRRLSGQCRGDCKPMDDAAKTLLMEHGLLNKEGRVSANVAAMVIASISASRSPHYPFGPS